VAAWERAVAGRLGKNGSEMTDLLVPDTARPVDAPPRPPRPFAASAALAGAVAAGAVLVGCLALGLAGWFASDAGSHGDTRDALRVGADAWLLGHGAHLDLGTATISVVPLCLTLLCGYVVFRLGRWAGAGAPAADTRTVLLGSGVLAGTYGIVAVVTAALASSETARANPGLAFVGGFALAFVGGGLGITVGSGLWSSVRPRVPETVAAMAVGAASAVLLVLAAASALVAVALLLDLGAAANVLSLLHTDVAGGALYTVVVAAVTPNAVLLGATYLLGPGFAVGTGTVVSASSVTLGPLPAFPLLAALPDTGPTGWWAVPLTGLPVLLAAAAAALAVRRFPSGSYETGALRGLGAGILGGAGLAALASLAGGSVGPGRMADIGASRAETLVAAVVAMGIGGLVGGLAMTWRLRRREPGSADGTAAD
jgi:LPXTG-motif cell wall-anchored protein